MRRVVNKNYSHKSQLRIPRALKGYWDYPARELEIEMHIDKAEIHLTFETVKMQSVIRHFWFLVSSDEERITDNIHSDKNNDFGSRQITP